MPSLDAISRALIGRLDERQDDELAGLNAVYLGALERTIDRARRGIPRDDEGRLVPDPLALARLRGAFERFGDGAGASLLLEEHVGRVRQSLARMVDVIDSGLASLGEDPLAGDSLALSQLVADRWLERFAELGRYHHALVRDAVTRAALGRVDERRLAAEFARLSDRASSEADRLHHDALIGYSRAVNAERAEQLGFEYFEYFGPADDRTRPFCRRHVGRVYARAEIERLDNGQVANVLQTGGGHRCRHHWRPVRPEWFGEAEWRARRPRRAASVRDVDIDMVTEWDRENALDFEEISALVEGLDPDEREEVLLGIWNDWLDELEDVWVRDGASTPDSRRMARESGEGRLRWSFSLTREEFERHARKVGWREDLIPTLTGFQFDDRVFLVVEGNDGLLSIATHESRHVLDVLDDLDLGLGLEEVELANELGFELDSEAGLTELEDLWERERVAWLAEEEFRLSIGEDAIWPVEDGVGVDEDAMMQWIRENYAL